MARYLELHGFSLALAVAALAVPGCDLGDNGGGANSGQQAPGNMDDGVALGEGEIAVSPRGSTFLARIGEQLVHGNVDGSWRALPELGNPRRLVFSSQREVVYVVVDEDEPTLRAHQLIDDKPLWTTKLDAEHEREWWEDIDGYDPRPWLFVTRDDRWVVVVGWNEVSVYDAKSGRREAAWTSKDQIVDVDVARDGSEIYVAHAERWKDDRPWSAFSTMSLPNLKGDAFWVPNCADEVVLDKDNHYALMAPTTCGQDPVSIIDTQTGKFIRNLPGFGPVALAADGTLAIAFMDLDNLDESLFREHDPMPEGDRRYHLMLIDTKTLDFRTVELGDSLPRYVPTPDGKLLLVDANAWYDDERVRIFDLQTEEFEPILGPDVRLEEFVLTRDSKRAYLVDDGAYELSIPERILSSLPLSIIPTNLNLTPDDHWLLLQDDFGPVHVYDIEAGKMAQIVGEAIANRD